MDLKQRIDTLVKLGEVLSDNNEFFQAQKKQAYLYNKWFIEDNINKSIQSIINEFLNRQKLENWVANYSINDINTNKNVGIIMAGNIPLVGFHDMISVFISGHIANVKLSSKDEILMKYVLEQLYKINPEIKDLIIEKERLNNLDYIIATGSNNSYRYFEYYFGKLPHIIRKNRNGIAILDGNETEEQLVALSKDIFDYFGLGCRNVSKIYVPKNYDFPTLIKILDRHQYLKQHNKYMNNYDYNLAISMLNKDKIFQSEVVFLKEDISYLSRIANIHYELYDDINSLKKRILNDEELLQVVATKSGAFLDFDREVKFGNTQNPSLSEYSDGIDIMAFLNDN